MGGPGTEAFSAVHVRRNSTLESKKSSPLKNAGDKISPKKEGKKTAGIYSPKSPQQPPLSHLPSPSNGANVDEQQIEARVKGMVQHKEMVNLEEALRPPSLDSEVPVNPVKPSDEPTNVLDEANDVSYARVMNNEEEGVPLLQSVTLESWSTESRREEKVNNPSAGVELQRSEEATLSNEVSTDEFLCRQSEDAVRFNLGADTKAGDAIENNDGALSASTSSSSPSVPGPSLLGAAETKTDATGLGNKGTESFENLDPEQPGDRKSESFGHRQLAGIDLPESDPDIAVLHEGKSETASSSSLEVDRDLAAVLNSDATGFGRDCELGVKDHGTPRNTGMILVTDDSMTKAEISAPREQASPTPSDDVTRKGDALDTSEQVAGSSRTTRSGSRFSDETNMLRDFLSRAQARKAAKEVSTSAEAPGLTTPRRSPRKPLAEIHNDATSPDKTARVSKRRGTPPGKAKLEMGEMGELDELDELEEADQQRSCCRRSTRTRLFTPARPAPAAPSLIPVRRAEGGDRVRLQRSLAQELATVTRSNTRRNRGQSKPPKLALQSLPVVEPVAVGVVGPRGERCGKSVGWDATLVYFQATSGMAPGQERRRPRRTRPVEAPGEGGGGWVGLSKEATETPTANARLKSPSRRRNKG